MTSDLTHKLDELVALLKSYGSVALGFSGGVDSTFLAAVSARFTPRSTTLVHLINPFAATPEQNSVRQLAHVEADGTKSVIRLGAVLTIKLWEKRIIRYSSGSWSGTPSCGRSPCS